MSTPAMEPSKMSQFCDKLSTGIQKATTFAKEQGSKAVTALRDLAKKIAAYVGPHLTKSKEFAIAYSKTHKDQIVLLGVGAAVGSILFAIVSKMCGNRSNGNPNGVNNYTRL